MSNMVKLKDLLYETNVRLSAKKDASFEKNKFVQILGLKGKVKLDRKSLSQLVKFVRGPVGREAGLGLSFTMARRDEEKLNEFKSKLSNFYFVAREQNENVQTFLCQMNSHPFWCIAS